MKTLRFVAVLATVLFAMGFARNSAGQTPSQRVFYEYDEILNLSALPAFDGLTPVKTGIVGTFDISVRNRNDDFAFLFASNLDVPADGVWTFYTNSDDGSQLFIDGQLVVDNDGLHGNRERSGTITLTAGPHVIEVTMFERGGAEILGVSWQGPGVLKQAIPADRLFLNDPPTPRHRSLCKEPSSPTTGTSATARRILAPLSAMSSSIWGPIR